MNHDANTELHVSNGRTRLVNGQHPCRPVHKRSHRFKSHAIKIDRDSSPGVGVLQRIENRLHRAAVVLAEELDFERAAQRLQISVSGLKEQIDQLECKLSLVLFERDSNRVELTASGKLYIEQIRKSRLF